MYNTLYRCLYCMLPKTNPTVSIHMLPLKSSRPIPFEPPFFSPTKIAPQNRAPYRLWSLQWLSPRRGWPEWSWRPAVRQRPRGNFREGFSKRFSGKRNNGIQGLAQHKPAKTKFSFRKNKVNQILLWRKLSIKLSLKLQYSPGPNQRVA